jgi:hypothetical protein
LGGGGGGAPGRGGPPALAAPPFFHLPPFLASAPTKRNPAVEQQAQDRIHRLGQYKPMRVTRRARAARPPSRPRARTPARPRARAPAAAAPEEGARGARPAPSLAACPPAPGRLPPARRVRPSVLSDEDLPSSSPNKKPTLHLSQIEPRFVVGGTIEERILKLQEKKQLVGAVGGEGCGLWLTNRVELRYAFVRLSACVLCSTTRPPPTAPLRPPSHLTPTLNPLPQPPPTANRRRCLTAPWGATWRRWGG